MSSTDLAVLDSAMLVDFSSHSVGPKSARWNNSSNGALSLRQYNIHVKRSFISKSTKPATGRRIHASLSHGVAPSFIPKVLMHHYA